MYQKKRRRNYLISAKSLRKVCPLSKAGIKDIHHLDIELLKCFLSEKGKIIPRRISGLTARNQKLVSAAIKRARNMALLSFAEGYVPQFEPSPEGARGAEHRKAQFKPRAASAPQTEAPVGADPQSENSQT